MIAFILAAALAQGADVSADAPNDRLAWIVDRGSPEERRRAMQILADRKAEGAVHRIAAVAEAPETDLLTRQMAVSCLASLRDRAAIPTLLKLLKPDLEKDLTFRAYVADRLAEWTHQCIPFFLFDPETDPAEAKKIEDASVNAWLTWWLEDREKDEAQWIERGIGRAIDLLRSPDDAVRGFAIQHLKSQTDLDFGYDPQAEAEPRAAAIRRWERWWIENRARLRWDPDSRRLVVVE